MENSDTKRKCGRRGLAVQFEREVLYLERLAERAQRLTSRYAVHEYTPADICDTDSAEATP